MTSAILSDIHANLEALQAVLEDLEQRDVEQIVFLGDAVGYGANPLECWKIVERISDIQVAGNHDAMVAKMEMKKECHDKKLSQIQWTGGQVGLQIKAKLAGLSFEHVENEICFVHGSPFMPAYCNYILTDKDAERGFAASGATLIFVGHTHVPSIWKEVEHRKFFGGEMRKVKVVESKAVRLEKTDRYIINVGSVGQPRDGDPRAAYGTYDQETGNYQLHRVPYDIETAARKIKMAGLPEELGARLRVGK